MQILLWNISCLYIYTIIEFIAFIDLKTNCEKAVPLSFKYFKLYFRVTQMQLITCASVLMEDGSYLLVKMAK